MMPRALPVSPERWITQVFQARTAAEGGIVRRSVADVERLIGRERFRHEVARRGFRMVENAGHFVIFCNTDPIRVVV